jgi:hypothetical protein
MQFPVAVPNDGMVDLVIQGNVSCIPFLALVYTEIYPPLSIPFSQMSRFEMLKSFDGAEKGSAYWQDKVNTVFPNLPTIADRLLKGTIHQNHRVPS